MTAITAVKKMSCAALLLLVSTTGLFATGQAPITSLPVEKVKAGYIYQFSQFVKWPQRQAEDYQQDNFFSICVLGDDPVTRELEPLNYITDSGRRIKVSNPKIIEQTAECHILYIAETLEAKLPLIFNYLLNKPVLTVGSSPGFASKGGIIGFVSINNKIHLEINRVPAERTSLKLNAKLLEVASKVLDDRHEEQIQ